MSGPGERAMLPPTMNMRARAASAVMPSRSASTLDNGECRRQHERQKCDAWRSAHGRQIAQIDRERLVADVCRADERPIEVYAFDLTIGSDDFERVPLGLHDRRVVADSHDHESGRRGEALADPFNQSMFPDFFDSCQCCVLCCQCQFATLRTRRRAFPE